MPPGGEHVVVPAHRRAAGDPLHLDAAGGVVQVQRRRRARAVHRHLLQPLVLGVVGEAELLGPLRDALRQVVGGPFQRAAGALQQVAVGVVAEERVRHVVQRAGDGVHRVLRHAERAAHRAAGVGAAAVAVAADVGLGQDAAMGVVARGLADADAGGDRRAGQPVQHVVAEVLAARRRRVGPLGAVGQVAAAVPAVARALDRARGARADARQPAGGRAVALRRRHRVVAGAVIAVAEGGELPLGVHRARRPVRLVARRLAHRLQVAQRRVAVVHPERRACDLRRVLDADHPALPHRRGVVVERLVGVAHRLRRAGGRRVQRQRRRLRPALGVVAVAAAVERRAGGCAGLRRHRRQLADAGGAAVVGPGGVEVVAAALAARQRPAQLVVGRTGDLALGVGLRHQLAEGVVAVLPAAGVGVDLPDLAPAPVVAQLGDDLPRRARQRLGQVQVAERVVPVVGVVARRIGDPLQLRSSKQSLKGNRRRDGQGLSGI